jgi:hypothetical protein
MNSTVNRGVHEHGLRKRRESFLEENRKLVQFKIDHPETEKTQIQTGEKRTTIWCLLDKN